jgi:hypothetical protein
MFKSLVIPAARGKHQRSLQPLLLLLSPGQQQHTLVTHNSSSTSFEQLRHNSSSSSNERVQVPIELPSVCVWGANTAVGKTLISAGLVAAAVRNQVGPTNSCGKPSTTIASAKASCLASYIQCAAPIGISFLGVWVLGGSSCSPLIRITWMHQKHRQQQQQQ